MQLTLGPVLLYWQRQEFLDFYAAAAECADIDTICLGETVCSKRRALATDDWLALARDLMRDYGKQVLLSTLTLIEAESELGVVRRLAREVAATEGLRLEANDFSAVQAARDAGAPFVAGSTLNVYNAQTLQHLARAGARGWVAPVELSREAIAAVIAGSRTLGMDLPCEVFSWGRLPLAWSARCFTARAHNLPKDQCGFQCATDADGLPLATTDGVSLFRLNGIQTQSERHCNLFGEAADMAARGIASMRVSLDRPADIALLPRLAAQMRGEAPPVADADLCNGYWFGTAGMAAGAA